MPSVFAPNRLEEARTWVSRHLGLAYGAGRERDLVRGLKAAAREHRQGDVAAYLDWLLCPPVTDERINSLAPHLTIGETYFYREPAYLKALSEEILPRLIEEGRRRGRCLRLWSAGCCTGEEPYTLAILLAELLPDFEAWNLTLYGTDLNPRFLETAGRGAYRAWSFRDTPDWFTARYFEPAGDGRLEVVPRIRRRVRFAPLNLACPSFPPPFDGRGDFDLIFCRNVLMYLTGSVREAAVAQFHACLREGGWFQVSATEAPPPPPFVPETVGGTVYYRRAKAGESAVRAVERRSAPPPKGRRRAVRMEAPPAPAPRPAPPAAVPTGRPAPPEYALPAPPEAGQSDPMARARACADAGDLEAALRHAEAAVAADPVDPQRHFLLASILQARERDADAVAALRRALFLDPQFVVARFSLGNLYRRQGKDALARKMYGQIRATLAGSPPETVLPAGDGLTAGQLFHLTNTLLQRT